MNESVGPCKQVQLVCAQAVLYKLLTFPSLHLGFLITCYIVVTVFKFISKY